MVKIDDGAESEVEVEGEVEVERESEVESGLLQNHVKRE